MGKKLKRNKIKHLLHSLFAYVKAKTNKEMKQ